MLLPVSDMILYPHRKGLVYQTCLLFTSAALRNKVVYCWLYLGRLLSADWAGMGVKALSLKMALSLKNLNFET